MMERICGECAYYRHEDLESPCERGSRSCGFLKENLPCFTPSENEGKIETKELTKVCGKCGQALPLKMFRKTRKTLDGYSVLCKKCKIHDTPRRKVRRKKYELE